jgi:hypothetical protein
VLGGACAAGPGPNPVSRRASADLTTAREGSSAANLWCWLAGPAWGRAHWRLLWRVLAQSGHHLLLNSLEMDSHSVADRAMTDIAWQESDPIEYSRLRAGNVTPALQQPSRSLRWSSPNLSRETWDLRRIPSFDCYAALCRYLSRTNSSAAASRYPRSSMVVMRCRSASLRPWRISQPSEPSLRAIRFWMISTPFLA